MNNFKNNIDNLVSKILNEEIENKVKQISEEMGEWTEIEVDEQRLKGGQKFIAKQAEPKDKITAADFKKLRDKKEDMAKWLNKKWKFSYMIKSGEIERVIEVKECACIEQSLSAIYELKPEEIDELSILSIDIGHSTGDCCLVLEGVPSINFSDWANFEGVKKCYDMLKPKLVQSFQSQYNIYDLYDKDIQIAIETGFLKIKNTKTINKLIKYIKDIINLLNTL